jgi:phage shock protein PspC (stress-responsive transcriptional regulator)
MKLSYALTRVRLAVDRIRRAEPAWLATKRKAIAGPITGAIVGGLAHRYQIHLDAEQTLVVGMAVAGAVSWAVPNKPATP